MEKRRHFALGSATLVCAFLTTVLSDFSAAAEDSTNIGEQCSSTAVDLNSAITARRANGFTDDATAVAQINCSDSVWPSRIGVPITAQEDRELTRRTTVGESLAAINEQQKILHPESFVNSWIDTKSGEAVFAFTAGSSPDLSTIKAALAPDTPVRVTNGAVPLGRQDEVNAAIINNFAALRDSGLKIVGSDTDPNTGVITVAIDPSNAPDAEKRLSAILGEDGVKILRADSSEWGGPQDARTAPTGRQYGGAAISSPNNGSGCTSSPSAKSNAGSFYTVTAGHCGHPGYSWRQGNALDADYPLGSGQGNTLYPAPADGTTDCDCQGIGVLSSTKRTSGVLINSNAVYLYTSSAGEGNYYTGRNICFSGAYEYQSYGQNICGHIRGLNGSYTLTPGGVSVLVYNLVQADFNTTLGGDSGGSYGDGTSWFGVHFGLISCGTVSCSAFSRSSRVISNLAIYLQNLGY